MKIDADAATADLRVCEPDAAGHCGTLLFAGPLALGASAEVCVAGELLVYEEWDLAQAAFGPPTSAVCQDGGDVEL